MSSISSSCIDGYGNLTMHQQVSSTSNFYNQNINSNGSASQRYYHGNGSIGYANEWAGIPLIKSNSSSSALSSTSPEHQHARYHKKLYPTRGGSNSFDFDEKSMSRLAKHTQGAPIIMSNSNRYRSNKPVKTMQSSFNHENIIESRNFNNNNNNSGSANNYVTLSKPTTPLAPAPQTAESGSVVDESQHYEDAGYNSNGTCLPRIIKPRKRRKKDRKPIVSTSNAEMMNQPPTQHLQQPATATSSYPFTFAPNQSSNGYLPSMTSSSNSSNCGLNAFSPNAAVKSENFTRTMPANDMNLFFNCDFDTNTMNPHSSSAASSPISLSNSSLSSSSATTSSCSCRLCDPNCRIWAFPLRRSFSDNSATELDRYNDVQHHESLLKKDVGVIGGNRVKIGPTNTADSSLSIFDMIELNNYQNNRQQSQSFMLNRLRSESLSDSGDSGCDLLLGNLNISDEILTSTLETMSDGLTGEGLNAITQKLSEFNILPSPSPSTSEKQPIDFNCNIIGNNNRLFSEHLNFHANESVDDHNRQLHRVNNLDLSTFNTNSKLYSTRDFAGNNNHLEMVNFNSSSSSSSSSMASVSNCNNGSPMSPILVSRPNSNNLDFNNNNNPTPIVCNSMDDLKERTLFDCFNNMTWTRPS